MHRRSVDVVVISDAHLGSYGSRAKELLSYLKSISPKILILNGDIIDGWHFSKRFFPSSHVQVIKEVLGMMSNGTKVFYITGNHDDMMRKYGQIGLGNFVLCDKIILDIDGKKVWVFHGDAFDAIEKKSFKLISRAGSKIFHLLVAFDRILNGILKRAGIRKIAISKTISKGFDKAMSSVQDFESKAAGIAIQKGYDIFICGHIHKPQHRVIETEKGKVVYLNSGDWVEHCTALECIAGNWQIYNHDGHQHKDSSSQDYKLDVFTDHIYSYKTIIK